MKAFTIGLAVLFISLTAMAQMTSPPDSILKKVEGMKNISAIKYLEDTYGNGKVKSKGWAYLFQDGKKTKFVRLGHWEYFRKDGTKEFEDFLPVNDDLPVRELHYDKDGKMWKKVLHAQEFDKNKNLKGDTYIEEVYYEDGNLKTYKEYKDGKKTGTWTEYDESGTVVKTKEYGSAE